jgi:hypothetical protein
MKQEAKRTHKDREVLMVGLREGGRKAINMNKISKVLQKLDKSPAQFYERLHEAYHLYCPFNPKAPEDQRMISATFVRQDQGNIRKKLQKLGFAGMNVSQLLEVATKVFVN